jgi:ATP-dependent Clp protease ATP-binding subunit ClpB
MTSNIGSHHLMDLNRTAEERERLIQEDLHRFFRPEFLNRLDDVIFFNPITEESLLQIVRIQLKQLVDRASEQGLKIKIEKPVLEWLAKRGYDPQFGARPLKRLIQREVGNLLARFILNGSFDTDRDYILKVEGESLRLV